MKITDVKQAYSAQLNTLQAQRQVLRKALQEQEAGGAAGRNFDRVELSRELKQLDAQYEATRQGMEGVMARETMLRSTEAAKQQGEAVSDQCKELAKILEVYRRIASGGRVPATDERKLMEYSSELYMAAKNMAFLKSKKGEDYDSLWKDEEENGKEAPPGENAESSEIAGAFSAGAAEASPAMELQV